MKNNVPEEIFCPKLSTDFKTTCNETDIRIKSKNKSNFNCEYRSEMFQLIRLDSEFSLYKAWNIKIAWILYSSKEILKFIE